MRTSIRKKKALFALGMLICFGAALLLFIIAADEQSIISSGSPTTEKVRLQDLITHGSGSNKHIELADFYFGKRYIYAAKLVQFKEVYVPVFPKGETETGDHLQLLVWIRNDRNSNQRLIESEQDLDQSVAEFNRNGKTLSGVLRKPIDRVQSLAVEAYPGTNPSALRVLWARDFPGQKNVNLVWIGIAFCLVAAAACGIAYRRIPRVSMH